MSRGTLTPRDGPQFYGQWLLRKQQEGWRGSRSIHQKNLKSSRKPPSTPSTEGAPQDHAPTP